MKQRLQYIDRAKGILIILMVIGHIWQAGYLHNVIYTFHMPAFFGISGILMCHTRSYEKPYKQFFLNRLYAFGIPFLFFEVLGVLTDLIRHGVTLNIKGYIYNTVTLHFNDANMWFLVDLFLIELIFVTAKKLLKKRWMVCSFCMLLFVLSLLLPTSQNTYLKTLFSVCYHMIFFMFGFYGKVLLEKKNSLITVFSAAVLFVVAALFGRRTGLSFSVANAAFVLSGLAGAYCVIQLGLLPISNRFGRFFDSVGKNSIVIYGTHHIIYTTVGVLLGITDFATTPLLEGIIILLIVALAEVPIIYIINRWLPFLAGKRYNRKQLTRH